MTDKDNSKAAWLNWLAVTTILFSTCATIASFKGGGYGSGAMMAQTQASDLWAQYQAKSIKRYIESGQADTLALRLPELSGASADAYRKQINTYKTDAVRLEKDKEEIAQKARALEQKRDDSQKHGGKFGLAILFLQLSIMLSALAAVMKKKPLWLTGVAIGAIGMIGFVNGFFLWF